MSSYMDRGTQEVKTKVTSHSVCPTQTATHVADQFIESLIYRYTHFYSCLCAVCRVCVHVYGHMSMLASCLVLFWLATCVRTHVYVRTLIWLLSQWQVENGSTACHWSSVIHSQQWSMEAEKPAPIVMLSYMDSWSHYLALDPTDSFSLQYSLFTANLFPLARPADNLLYAVLILFMDLS